jgi:hypothetical protein
MGQEFLGNLLLPQISSLSFEGEVDYPGILGPYGWKMMPTKAKWL